MCLAVPARIIEKNADSALADLHGNRMQISVILTPAVQPGDWVLVHAGFAIEQLNAACAAETFALLAEVEICATTGTPCSAAVKGAPARRAAKPAIVPAITAKKPRTRRAHHA